MMLVRFVVLYAVKTILDKLMQKRWGANQCYENSLIRTNTDLNSYNKYNREVVFYGLLIVLFWCPTNTFLFYCTIFIFVAKKKENRVYNSVGIFPHTMSYMRRNGNPISACISWASSRFTPYQDIRRRSCASRLILKFSIRSALSCPGTKSMIVLRN